MELFPVHPDLSLQVTPPNTNSTPPPQQHDLGFWKRAMETTTTTDSLHGHPSHFNYQQQLLHHHPFRREGSSTMNPIRGIPIYHAPPNSCPFHRNGQLRQQDQQQNLGDTPPSTFPFVLQGMTRTSPRFLSRFPPKRNMRAPRMRWTTLLHARFLHAVELLGGHERATPKSVLELMDVKDLTLAHVKSHLQMYRTLKTTDRAAASSGQTEPIEISDDNVIDVNGSEASSEGRTETSATASSDDSCGALRIDSSSIPGEFLDKPRNCTTRSTNSIEDERLTKGFELTVSDSNPILEFTLGRRY